MSRASAPIMDEQFAFMREVFARLEAAGIPAMLTGSLALAVWARPRMTRDLDVVIEADPEQVSRLVEALATDCYVSPEAAGAAARDRTMFNAIHLESLLKADFILRREEPYELAKFARRRMVELDGVRVPVISPEDLVLSKLQWASGSGSRRQAEDVREMLTAGPPLDAAYLDRWATALHLTSALSAARAS